MDRIYVRHQNKVPVHQLGLNLWRDTVVRNPRIQVPRIVQTLGAVFAMVVLHSIHFMTRHSQQCRLRTINASRVRNMQDRLQSILLDMVTRERSGDVIDRSLMRSITMVGPKHSRYLC
jgi:Cullin family